MSPLRSLTDPVALGAIRSHMSERAEISGGRWPMVATTVPIRWARVRWSGSWLASGSRDEPDLPGLLHCSENGRLHFLAHRFGIYEGGGGIEASFDFEAKRPPCPPAGKFGAEHSWNGLGYSLGFLQNVRVDAVHEVMHELGRDLVAHIHDEQ